MASGSGFLVRDSQTVVTNYHVIDDAETVHAVFSDGSSFAIAAYFAIVPAQDLAVVSLERPMTGLVPLSLAELLPRAGERVLALGAPQGLANSASDGIFSALRTGQDLDAATQGLISFTTSSAPDTTWLQISAPISHGNSGGPLLNSAGQVIGVNAIGLSKPGTENLNFAVSVRHVQQLMAALPTDARPLAALPNPPKTQAEIAAEREAAKQEADERALIAKAEADRKRLLATIESAKLSRERQAELQRLSDQIGQVLRELSRVETEGIALRTRRDTVLAEGKAEFVLGSQIARRSAVAITQLAYLEGCANRRQAVVSGLLAVLDDHPAPYNELGLAQVRAEYSLKYSDVTTLRTEATLAEASFAKLDQDARSLLVQLSYLSDQRETARKELERLLDQQAKLEAKAVR